MKTLKTIALPGLILGFTPAALWAAEDGPGLFSVNLGLSLWTVLIFAALLVLLRKFAWGPILEQVQAREDRIQNALDESRESREEAQKLLEEHKAQLADARRQASEIVAEARNAGQSVRQDIEDKARDEARQIVEAARREIQREKDAALVELRKESVDLALAAAAKLMKERLDSERDRELVVNYLESVAADQGVEA